MDVILPQARTTTVEFYPPESRPASATVRFLSPEGAELATPTATVDTLSRTIDGATDAETYAVSGATGTHAAGRLYWWTSAADSTLTAQVMLSEVSGSTWYLEKTAATILANAGDTFRGARITAPISSTATAARGENYRIEWTVTGADGVVRIYDQVAHVTRKNIRPAVDAMAARDYFVSAWPDIAQDRRFGYFCKLAARASDRVWRRIRAMGRFVHLLVDSDDFSAAGRVALEREAAADNLIPPNTLDAQAYRDGLDAQLNREIEDVISSRPYDEDDDTAISPTETAPVSAIRLVRW